MKRLTNQDWIEKYKNDNIIIETNFSDKNNILIDGIISPLKIDNRQICSPTDNQGNSPHCAGYSAAQMIEAIIWKQTGRIINLDAHQIYAKAKELDNCIDAEGTYPEATLQAAINLSALKIFNNAKIHKIYNIDEYETITAIKHIIHKYDFLIGGFYITDEWYNCINGKYVISHGTNNLGGHAVLICGYDKKYVYIQNHWSKNWGAKGFAAIPWKVFLLEFMYGTYLELN